MTTGISIHAPTRGTTFGLPYQVQVLCTFQSTLPRGERPLNTMVTKPSGCDFNPRSHEGNDVVGQPGFLHKRIFQSTLPRGERLSFLVLFSPYLIFQSTLPRGERLIALEGYCDNGHFNPRSHEGNDDSASPGIFPSFTISIHAPTRGTTEPGVVYDVNLLFQSTLPRGERL